MSNDHQSYRGIAWPLIIRCWWGFVGERDSVDQPDAIKMPLAMSKVKVVDNATCILLFELRGNVRRCYARL